MVTDGSPCAEGVEHGKSLPPIANQQTMNSEQYESTLCGRYSNGIGEGNASGLFRSGQYFHLYSRNGALGHDVVSARDRLAGGQASTRDMSQTANPSTLYIVNARPY